jgi:hypothetical protein
VGTGEMVNTGTSQYPNCNGTQCSTLGATTLCEGYGSVSGGKTTYYSQRVRCQ